MSSIHHSIIPVVYNCMHRGQLHYPRNDEPSRSSPYVSCTVTADRYMPSNTDWPISALVRQQGAQDFPIHRRTSVAAVAGCTAKTQHHATCRRGPNLVAKCSSLCSHQKKHVRVISDPLWQHRGCNSRAQSATNNADMQSFSPTQSQPAIMAVVPVSWRVHDNRAKVLDCPAADEVIVCSLLQ
jgi:hypothetical protein